MTVKDENIFPSVRLKEERNRLKITQQAVAEQCNTTVQTVRRWEKVPTIPMEKLAGLVWLGFDVQYVLTGLRSSNLDEVRELFTGLSTKVAEDLAMYEAGAKGGDPLLARKQKLKALLDQVEDVDLLDDIQAMVTALQQQRARRG